MRAWQIPLRLATGAFILNSGLEKWKADDETAERLQNFASGAYPVVKRVEPQQFAKALGTAEAALGGALLSPFVSPATAGLALGAFSGSLLNLYWKTPGLHRQHDPRPTPDGIPLAKDSWMAGVAGALLLGSLGGSGRRKHRRARAKAKAKARGAAHAAVATPTRLARAATQPIRQAA
jgi:hypothetical protein